MPIGIACIFLAGIMSDKYFHVFFLQIKQTDHLIALHNNKNASLHKGGDGFFVVKDD
jgi:hypothetical protein